MNELVSVIIPTFGGSSKLRRAIKSVILQTYTKIEIIIVDDNENDSTERKNTERILKEFVTLTNIYYIKHTTNKNGAAARNTGINHSKGKYLCFLDDDDFYLENRIETLVKQINKDKKYCGILTNVIITKNNKIISFFKFQENYLDISYIFSNWSIGTGSNIFVKRSSVIEINGFDSSFDRFQDLEFMIRLLEKNKIFLLNEFSVVKDDNGNLNFPKYNKLRENYDRYYLKFNMILSKKPIKIQESYYRKAYLTLFYSAIMAGNDKISYEYNNLNKYMKMKKIQKLYYFGYLRYLRSSKILTSFFLIYNRLKHFYSKKNLQTIVGKENYYLVNQFLKDK